MSQNRNESQIHSDGEGVMLSKVFEWSRVANAAPDDDFVRKRKGSSLFCVGRIDNRRFRGFGIPANRLRLMDARH
jgi:hypothetical protein